MDNSILFINKFDSLIKSSRTPLFSISEQPMNGNLRFQKSLFQQNPRKIMQFLIVLLKSNVVLFGVHSSSFV
jgi:hypothetical protein